MESLKQKNLVGVLGGWLALLGMFLPYVRDISFFQSLPSPEYGFFAPALTLGIALAALLYALGLTVLPGGVSWTLLVVCGAFPVYGCCVLGFDLVLPELRIGAWMLLGGLTLMGLHPLLSIGAEYFRP